MPEDLEGFQPDSEMRAAVAEAERIFALVRAQSSNVVHIETETTRETKAAPRLNALKAEHDFATLTDRERYQKLKDCLDNIAEVMNPTQHSVKPFTHVANPPKHITDPFDNTLTHEVTFSLSVGRGRDEEYYGKIAVNQYAQFPESAGKIVSVIALRGYTRPFSPGLVIAIGSEQNAEEHEFMVVSPDNAPFSKTLFLVSHALEEYSHAIGVKRR